MAEQLAMPLEVGPAVAVRPPRAEAPTGVPAAAAPRHRRPRPAGNRPVRGEPDLVESLPRGDWRIDPRTRLAGLRGIARARAALAATTPPADDERRVHAA